MNDSHTPHAPEAQATAPGKLFGVYLATVSSVKDDQNQGRIQVKLLAHDGVTTQSAPMWAWVAVPFAGASRGAFLIPNKDDIVVVQFIQGEPSKAIVTGGVWNGAQKAPETLGGDGTQVDRWTFTGKAGSRIAIVEEAAGATISMTTPSSTESVTITQKSSGKIELKTSTSTVTLDSNGVTVKSTKVTVQAPSVTVNSPSVTVNAALSTFNGVVKATAVQATTIIGSVYTPGAGNIW
jgi:uncharacterized protein involved in type VI secretion and phage assembly